jgi:methyl-accepting chemotaxis protein
MKLFGFVHHHPRHRARQLRWVLPIVLLVLAATVGTLVVQYQVSNQVVGTEFFHAHKTISQTGELLRRGTVIGSLLLAILVLALAAWAFRLTHRIVRPVHTLHRALDALVDGDLGVRIALHREDEFQEVGDALNRLIDEFATTLTKVHTLVDRVADLTTPTRAPDIQSAEQVQALVKELDQTMDFFRLAPRRTIREDGN